jgi:hypothetical protein
MPDDYEWRWSPDGDGGNDTAVEVRVRSPCVSGQWVEATEESKCTPSALRNLELSDEV